MAVYAVITTSDTTVLAPALIALWITTAGSLVFRGKGDSATVSIAATVGLLSFPYPVDKIMATGTTAVIGVGVQAG